jgi:hypothetical protein
MTRVKDREHFRFRTAVNNMAKAGEKSVGGGKRGLKRKAAAEEPQEAAAASDGTAESGVQPAKAAAFPPGFSISEIKNKQRRHLMFTRWKQQQRKVRARGWRGTSAGAGPGARGAGGGATCARGVEGAGPGARGVEGAGPEARPQPLAWLRGPQRQPFAG